MCALCARLASFRDLVSDDGQLSTPVPEGNGNRNEEGLVGGELQKAVKGLPEGNVEGKVDLSSKIAGEYVRMGF